jgi:hypothetical protein
MNKIKVAIVLICILFLTGCSTVKFEKKRESYDESMFVCVEKTYSWLIVYNKDTKVMYAVSNGGYNSGNFNVLVDAQGRPMLWESEE